MPEDVFLALAHPVRRRLLELLVDGPRTPGELAAQLELSRPSPSTSRCCAGPSWCGTSRRGATGTTP
ncbi:ArsR/SmtB family transcription factor [Geodermatophilus sp. SYSU D01186]